MEQYDYDKWQAKQDADDFCRMKARIAELEAALSFYADARRYQGPNIRTIIPDRFSGDPYFPYVWDVTRDGGKIARDVLEKET